MRVFCLFVFSLICFSVRLAPCADALAADDYGLAMQAVARAEECYEALSALQYRVERTTKAGVSSQKEVWTFSYAKPGSVRIDYLSPQARIVVLSGDHLYEYLADKAACLHTDMSAWTREQKAGLVGQVFARVTVYGLRAGQLPFPAKPTDDFKVQPGLASNTLAITWGALQNRVVVDTNRLSLVESLIYEEGRGRRSTSAVASGFIDVRQLLWMPSFITVKSSGKDFDTALTEYRLSDFKVNDDVPGTGFVFTPPAGTQMIENKKQPKTN